MKGSNTSPYSRARLQDEEDDDDSPPDAPPPTESSGSGNGSSGAEHASADSAAPLQFAEARSLILFPDDQPVPFGKVEMRLFSSIHFKGSYLGNLHGETYQADDAVHKK